MCERGLLVCVCERTCLSSPYHLRELTESVSVSLIHFVVSTLCFGCFFLLLVAAVCRGSSTGKALLPPLPPLPTSLPSLSLFAACGPFGHSVEFSRVSVKTQPTAIWWHIRSMATVWITGARFVLLSHIISGIIVIGIVRSI